MSIQSVAGNVVGVYLGMVTQHAAGHGCNKGAIVPKGGPHDCTWKVVMLGFQHTVCVMSLSSTRGLRDEGRGDAHATNRCALAPGDIAVDGYGRVVERLNVWKGASMFAAPISVGLTQPRA